MRRLCPALALVVALPLAGAMRTPRALAITYAPGWNLVSGPAGSHLVGAEGEIYTLQPGDGAYEAFPADAPLSAGYGYWAFFPRGGRLEAAAGTPSYSVTLLPDQWALVGNPTADTIVALSGARAALVYVPGDGYVSVAVIPPGVGAWVLGSGQLALSAPDGPPLGRSVRLSRWRAA